VELMAIVKCPDCAKVFDDFYRWTFCPHEAFQPSASAAADPLLQAYAAAHLDFEPRDDVRRAYSLDNVPDDVREMMIRGLEDGQPTGK
jgi:hypothetical protein